ncbi:uncharacterized protein Bfra_000767 [Botrytis fragariae]|uniref:Uncharacterized protein n=1 Tax=Botrytis fragariae TaxID=1964551 RepID=A0A8H6B3S0_9HELO|nr:uncharacterized protein Bfra_000767 [Botrytis fragariae]KAF5878600.1 hypothetical protein Bfra_000767 [Botrytis fragariae]
MPYRSRCPVNYSRQLLDSDSTRSTSRLQEKKGPRSTHTMKEEVCMKALSLPCIFPSSKTFGDTQLTCYPPQNQTYHPLISSLTFHQML